MSLGTRSIKASRWWFALPLLLAAGCGDTGDSNTDQGAVDAAADGAVDLSAAIADLSVAPTDAVFDLTPVNTHRDASHLDSGALCSVFCPNCDSNSDCFASSNTSAVCLQHCQTNTDCPMGYSCAELVYDPNDVQNGNPPYQYSARLCFSAAAHLPAVCGGVPANTTCQIPDGAICFDGTTLESPVSAPGTCGFEFVTCADGCQPGPGDGGLGATCK